MIQFIANYDEWQAVKKIKIEEKTSPVTVMEFLASLGTGIDKKIEANLRKVVDLKKIDSALSELQAGKSKEQIAETIAEINSRKVNAVINEICGKPEMQPKEQKELQQFCKVFAMRKALNACELSVDYSSVEVPGMGRLKKAKV